jgi:hypothetical protein
MTAEEHLAIWVASPNDELFVDLEYPGVVSEVSRMRAGDVLAGYQTTARIENGIARSVLARFQKETTAANRIRVHSSYRVFMSSVQPFV